MTEKVDSFSETTNFINDYVYFYTYSKLSLIIVICHLYKIESKLNDSNFN